MTCSRARAVGVSAEKCQKASMYARLLLPFQIHKCFHLLSNGSEKYGLPEWRNGRRWVRLLLRAQREGPPRTREEEMLDAGRIRLVSEKLQAFYVQGNHLEMTTFFPPERATYKVVHLF